MNIIKKFKKDTRGAALVYVIIASAIVILLAAATTVAAYVNLQTTKIREQSDNNFYNADSIMSAIVSGLEGDVSLAYDIAYAKVLSNQYDTALAAKSDFGTWFKEELFGLLNDGKQTADCLYSPMHIQKYVQEVFPNNLGYTVTALNGNNFIDNTESGIVLRNLHITYENENGYYDEITTDIKIDIPDPGIIDVPKQLQINALVVDDGLELNINSGLKIHGNVYINEREDDKSAIFMNGGTSLQILTPNELIAGGYIETKEDAKLTISGTDNQYSNNIWTENINLGRYADVEIFGQIYIYDDLEINGSYSDVRLAGKYYGYSKSSTNVNQSSSINVNGAGTKLDIQGLDRLVLAGSSYISTSTVPSDKEGDDDKNIQLGEAFSVKSNQIAYLVDDTEFLDSDLAGFISNPMTYDQYDEMCRLMRESCAQKNGGVYLCDQCPNNECEGWHQVAEAMASQTLSYGDTYAGYGANVIRVFSNEDISGAVYFYLDFTTANQAANFFKTAYEGNTLLSQRLRTYAAQYITELTLSADTELLVNENYIDSSVTLYTKDQLPSLMNGLGYDNKDVNDEYMDNLLANCATQYLGKPADELAGTPAVIGEKYKITFNKLIDTNNLIEFIRNAVDNRIKNKNCEIDKIENFDGVILTSEHGSQAIIVDNANSDAYVLGTGSGLVIVTGDLKLTGDWNGTIIVGGRVYCERGTKSAPLNLVTNDTAVSNVIPLYFTLESGGTTTSMSVINIFNGYEDAFVNHDTINGIGAGKISKCISFTNWNKD